ncbi:MAG: two-component regulator propeller domain-containing protein, partial [Acidobacteriota bacterium]
ADSKLKKNYTFANTSGGLRSDTIFTLFTDREGVLWIGTNRGVSRFDRQGSFQATVSDIPNSNFIRTLYQSPGEGRLLYAGSNRGLFSLNKSDGTWIEIPAFRNKVIYAIRKRYQPGTVVGTGDGVFDISGRKLLDGDVRGFAGVDRHDYAAFIGRGVVDLTADTPKIVIPNPGVTSVAEYRNKLWIGTVDGNLFSYDGETVNKEVDPALLKSGTIWKMFSGADGALWIAAQHGVIRVQDGQSQRIIDAEDVRDVFVDGADVWAATTTRGLLHARQDGRFGWLLSGIGFEQGLPSEKVFSIVPDDGLLIGTNRGVVAYRPGTIAPKLIPLRVLSQRVHDLAELKSTIELEYPQNSLLVEVGGQSSRTFPEEFQYAFVLKNAKDEVIDTRLSNDSQYSPADLSPGEYTIESIAFNRDLLASEPLIIKFAVAKAPFPWTATALGVLLVIALVGLVWAMIEHRRIAERNRELAAARLDLANEAERERRRIARDLHDQTLADLRNLMITSDKLTSDNKEFRSEIEAVSTEIRRICEDLSPSVLENVGLVAALEFLLDRTVENRKFLADATVEDHINFPLNVQLQIYRIAQEVLTNIVRHSSANIVEMSVKASDAGEFGLTIRDNGDSFRPEGAEKGRGIANIRSRANLVNGKASWKESRRGGNVFTLRIGPTSGAA